MIRVDSYNSGIPFAMALSEKGQTLVAKPGTLLAELVSKSIPLEQYHATWAYNNNDQDTIANFGTYVWVTTDDTTAGPSDHSMVLGNAVDQIYKLVAQHIAYAKSTVKPIVVELGEQLIAASEALRKNDSMDFNLDVKSVPTVLKDESFLDTLSYFKDRTPQWPKKGMKLGVRSTEDLMKLVVTGNQRIDQLILEWLSKQEENFLVKVWNTFFEVESNGPSIYSGDIDSMISFDRLDIALAAQLIARRIYDEVQTSDLSLSEYQYQVIEIRDWSGAQLAFDLRSILNMTKANTLVVAANIGRKKIAVNGELYDDWLSTGGTPEVILGMLVSGNMTSNRLLIDEKAEGYKRAWENYVLFQTTQNNLKYYDKIKKVILDRFLVQLKNEDEIEKSISATNQNRTEQLYKEVEEYLDTLSHQQLDQLYDIALYLVAKIRFSHTSSYQILSDINEASKANPNVDVREAALIAATNYLGDWLADQIMIVKQ